jgi:hypothetical protein
MRSLWGVARHTFQESLRTRVLLVFTVLLAVCVLAIGLLMQGDGTLKSRIQTFLAYSTGLTELLLGLVTIFLSTGMVSSDIYRKQIFTVVTKPLPRWQYVLGRWLGLAMLNALLLSISFASIYGMTRYLRTFPTLNEQKVKAGLLPEGEVDLDRIAVDSEVLTARADYNPDPFDVAATVQSIWDQKIKETEPEALIKDRIRQKLQADRLNIQRSEIPVTQEEVDQVYSDRARRQQEEREMREQLRQAVLSTLLLVKPADTLEFTFSHVDPPQRMDEPLELRYRLHPSYTPASMQIRTSWVVQSANGPIQLSNQNDSTESMASVLIPPEVVLNGKVTLYYINPNMQPPNNIRFDPTQMTLLVRSGEFGTNLLRGGAMILLRLTFLAALGLLFGVFLSFPVACLACLLALGVGMSSGFIIDATTFHEGVKYDWLDYACHYVARASLYVLPQLGSTSPVDSLVDGQLVRLGRLGEELYKGLGLRTAFALALACLIFQRRELARVQV